MPTLLVYALLGTLMVLQLNSARAQSQLWADEQPSSTYTIYNGKVYMHPKKEDSFFSNLFKLENLYNNAVVQTVLGWTDAFYGTPTINETDTDFPDALGSQNHPQYAPYNLPNSYQNPNGIPSNGEKYPQNPNLPNNAQQQSYYGKYPYNNGSPYSYNQQNQQFPSQQQYQQNPQQSTQYQQQQKQPQINNYGSYGQQAPQQYNLKGSYNKYYGNPNTEVVNQVESQGSMDSILSQSQERNYQSSFQPNPSYPSHSYETNELDKPSSSQSTPYSESATEGEKTESASSPPKSDSSDMEDKDDFPCPKLGQWKWNGEVCIAIGPYPTWACRPNDMVMSGRVAICRNKIFYPNEP